VNAREACNKVPDGLWMVADGVWMVADALWAHADFV
jgi:hypothetical protein